MLRYQNSWRWLIKKPFQNIGPCNKVNIAIEIWVVYARDFNLISFAFNLIAMKISYRKISNVMRLNTLEGSTTSIY